MFQRYIKDISKMIIDPKKNYYYHGEIPEWLEELSSAPCLKRLADVGMHCGCEHTHFPRFLDLEPYTRLRHSLGCALIVWHFTNRREDAVAALLHDVATPVFAHTIDFLRGDYLKQEATENGTEETIRNDRTLCAMLRKYHIEADAVVNYHRYPIADNDSPKLSADRLEYTLSNLVNFGFASQKDCVRWYEDLRVSEIDGAPELSFQTEALAESFALDALNCSRLYVCDEDRYAMQMLSELIRGALRENVLEYNDLYRTESDVIALLEQHPKLRTGWHAFCNLHEMMEGADAPEEFRRIIFAKKRWINPYVIGKGRVSDLSAAFREESESFLKETQDYPVCGR